jgi:uncharacterized sporulation protein YeaH/YhbH (DUF444 family)
MLHIVDRRLAGKNKSIGNRERFLRRHHEQIRDAMRKAIAGRGIRDLEQAENITIPRKDIKEPVFHHGTGGVRDAVHAGNRDYLRGDHIKRPQGGDGAGRGQAGDGTDGEDDFVFTLSKEEFMQLFFDDLALPRLEHTQIGDIQEWESRRAGFTREGTPNNLHIVRSMRNALGRRRALGGQTQHAYERKLRELAELENARWGEPGDEVLMHLLRQEIHALELRLRRIPFLDPLDLRFRSRIKVPIPNVKAVMFCLMDVSGSMDEARKSLSKQFFTLLYLFLHQHYEEIEIVFIRHHTQAQEVDEETFFHATESGGTVVSSALELMQKIMAQRYPSSEWNIYGAQASDGDNFTHDSGRCTQLLAQDILPHCRFYAYVQVANDEQNLWEEYAALAPKHPNFAMRKVIEPTDIYPVFRDLFHKEREGA